jgi:hypothetical protein
MEGPPASLDWVWIPAFAGMTEVSVHRDDEGYGSQFAMLRER